MNILRKDGDTGKMERCREVGVRKHRRRRESDESGSTEGEKNTRKKWRKGEDAKEKTEMPGGFQRQERGRKEMIRDRLMDGRKKE